MLAIGAWAVTQMMHHSSDSRATSGAASGGDRAAAMAIYDQGCQQYRAGNFDQSIALAKQAIDKYSGEPDFYNMEAVSCFSRNQGDDVHTGEELIHKAISMNPNQAKYWDNLARGLTMENKYADARAALAKELECNPPEAKAAEVKQNIQIIDKAMQQQ